MVESEEPPVIGAMPVAARPRPWNCTVGAEEQKPPTKVGLAAAPRWAASPGAGANAAAEPGASGAAAGPGAWAWLVVCWGARTVDPVAWPEPDSRCTAV